MVGFARSGARGEVRNEEDVTYKSPFCISGILPALRVHDLRHTAASLAIASGASVKLVQRQLGHQSATLTSTPTRTCSPTISMPSQMPSMA